MQLTVLGSGTCELRAQRSSTAYHVQAGAASIMMDLGQGSWRGLTQAYIDPIAVNTILLSHQHPDHIADIVPFLFALNYAPNMAGKKDVRLVAHREVLDLLERLEGVFGHWLTPDPETLQKTAAGHGDSLESGGVKIRAAKAAHQECSLAFRLDHGGSSLVYLGDSEATGDLADFAQEAEMIIAHCAATDQRPKPGHMSPTAAGELAAGAGAKALMLSHLYSDVDPDQAKAAAAKVFPGEVIVARDMMRLQIDGACHSLAQG